MIIFVVRSLTLVKMYFPEENQFGTTWRKYHEWWGDEDELDAVCPCSVCHPEWTEDRLEMSRQKRLRPCTAMPTDIEMHGLLNGAGVLKTRFYEKEDEGNLSGSRQDIPSTRMKRSTYQIVQHDAGEGAAERTNCVQSRYVKKMKKLPIRRRLVNIRKVQNRYYDVQTNERTSRETKLRETKIILNEGQEMATGIQEHLKCETSIIEIRNHKFKRIHSVCRI